MSDINEELKVGTYGGVELGNIEEAGTVGGIEVEEVTQNNNLPVTSNFWEKCKGFWLQDIPWDKEIKVELTPYQQKVEKEVNDFLHQEITWKKIHDFLFQEITFGKKK